MTRIQDNSKQALCKPTRYVYFLYWLIVVISGLIFPQNVTAQESVHYVITKLSPLPGDDVCCVCDINNAGQMAGVSWNSQANTRHAVLWNSNGAVQSLDALPNATANFALAINGQGNMVGFSDCLETIDSQLTNTIHAFFYDSAGMHEIVSMFSGEIYDSQAVGINNRGQIIGYIWPVSDSASASSGIAFLLQSSTLTEIGNTNISLIDVNDSGQVIGSNSNGPFLWQNGAITNLSVDAVYRINNQSQIVGAKYYDVIHFPRDWGYHAILYSNGTVYDLGQLGQIPGILPGENTYAFSVNNLGQVVGGTGNSVMEGASGNLQNSPLFNALNGLGLDSGEAWLWQNGVMTDLSNLFPTDWILSEAVGINDKGQIIGNGFSRQNGTYAQAAFLLTSLVGIATTPTLGQSLNPSPIHAPGLPHP
jgi:uncharacterized membrane protein